MLINENSAIPKYYQLKLHLREQILSGKLSPGEQTPPEQQLAKDYGISKMTVRQALAELAREGLLQRKPGVGTFVTQRKVQKNLVGDFVTFFESDSEGHQRTSQLLNVQRMLPEGRIRSVLQARPGDWIVRLERLLLADGEPVAFATVYIPESKCPDLLEEVKRWQSLIWLFEKKYHLSPVKAEQMIDAVTADAKVARLLEVEVDTPLLYVERTTYLDTGDPIEFTQTYLRSSKYSYHVTFYRGQSSEPGDRSTG